MLLLKLLKESFIFAINSVIVNKVRTILSLLGITIGIFSIISVLTVFDSLENSIKESFQELGNDVVFITKWPVIGGADTPWWKYWNRPQPKVEELKEIQKRSGGTDAAAAFFSITRNVKYRSNSIEKASILAVSHDYEKVIFFELYDGRYFTPIESAGGRNVVIIGSTIAETLFDQADPIGKEMKIDGRKVVVIGVFKKQGTSSMGNSTDDVVMMPLKMARNFVASRNINVTLAVKAREGVSNEVLIDELTGIIRSVRSIRAGDDNSFDISEVSMVTNYIDQIFGVISIVGWIIGGFSLLVGGFGIANIMFVSVKERTGQIGIQKALGAKNYFILTQFLFESVFLSLFGGILGLLLVYGGVFIATQNIEFHIVLTTSKIVVGLSISVIIGLIAGAIPAYNASRLDPVEAMRMV